MKMKTDLCHKEYGNERTGKLSYTNKMGGINEQKNKKIARNTFVNYYYFISTLNQDDQINQSKGRKAIWGIFILKRKLKYMKPKYLKTFTV